MVMFSAMRMSSKNVGSGRTIISSTANSIIASMMSLRVPILMSSSDSVFIGTLLTQKMLIGLAGGGMLPTQLLGATLAKP
ncbi:hypothetical protein D3C77_119740 [compost metagenome]